MRNKGSRYTQQMMACNHTNECTEVYILVNSFKRRMKKHTKNGKNFVLCEAWFQFFRLSKVGIISPFPSFSL